MNTFCKKTLSQFRGISHITSLESTICSLCNLGKLHAAVNLVLSHPIVQVDRSLYSKLLQLCINTKADNQGRIVHNHLLTNGFQSDLHFDTKLIIFYCKVGDTKNAREVFDKMGERSVVSWTALLSGYSQNDCSQEALFVFLTMHRAGVRSNQFTYGSILRACTSMNCLDTGKQIQGVIQKGRFVNNLFVQSALVDLHSKCGKMEDAGFIFKEMSDRDLVSWNAMICGFAVQGFRIDALLMFQSLLYEGMIPDSFTLGSVLKASVGGNCLTEVTQIHGFTIKLGFESHSILTGSLIDAYVKCGSVKTADGIYKSMLRKDTISCTALITGYAREGKNCRDAMDLFNELQKMHIRIDNVMLCSMLNICANTASASFGRQLHAIIVKCQPSNDIAIGNALIDMYSKSGEIEDANQAFDEMKEKNIISWTSLIAGYGKHGYGLNALSLYKEMESEGLKPNDVTFLSLLFSCSHNGLAAEGWECFNSMVSKYNITPRAEHYSCLVDLFARRGLFEEAYNLISKLNIKPNASLWGAILGACSSYDNMSLGEVAARHLFNMEPENSVNYVVLASIYAAAGLWDRALHTRKLMEDRTLQKDSGCSFFQSTSKRLALPLPS